MLRDVFYYGKKPNVHPREKFATSLADARNQCTTEHFWIINEFCDYTGFDWDFDFEFLPDEDVWAEDHNNVWPSYHQKDSGTWLCSAKESEVIIYRADVAPLRRKNELTTEWVQLERIDTQKFDFSWHPDPTEPPYIYRWGSKYYPVEFMPCLEYRVPGATEIKYMTTTVELLPNWDYIKEVQQVDRDKWDMSWRPDPMDPPFIYVWGNKYIDGRLRSTLEYHVPGATEIKYMPELVPVLPEWEYWNEVQQVDKTKFDFSWRPDPREPAYIYIWGNKYIDGTLRSTVEYHAHGATEKKYMPELVAVLPEWECWKEVQLVDKSKFDLSWRPDPREPAYIYVWGNKYIDGTLRSTLEYHAPGATEKKYMTELVPVLPEQDRWHILHKVNMSTFDFTWRPDPREPDFIYVFGNKQYSGHIMPTIEYRMPGATERKYVDELEFTADLAPAPELFECIDNIDKSKFDFTWRPDPTSPPYIYAWGNQWNKPEDKISVQFVVEGATEYTYMEPRAKKLPSKDNWVIPENLDVSKFDFSWEPNPHDPPYIYEFGTQWQKTGGPKYVVKDATEVKYMDFQKARILPSRKNWSIPKNVDVSGFDFSWHPDATSPPYIYHFPTQWALTGGPVYTCEGATEVKYQDAPTAVALPDRTNWVIPDDIDVDAFDFSWHPYVEDQPYVYQFGTQWQKTGGPKYITPGVIPSSPTKYIDTRIIKAKKLPSNKNWTILNNLKIEEFDYSWHPDQTEEPYIYIFGNNHQSAEQLPTLEYKVEGATQIKYVHDTIATLAQDRVSNWQVPANVDVSEFDFSWKPSVFDPMPYIYQFGTQWQKTGGPRYVIEDAVEVKYIEGSKAKRLPDMTNWKVPDNVDVSNFNFDFSWHPDDTSPPYIYQFGTQWAMTGGPVYTVPGAKEKRYQESPVAVALPDRTNWEIPDDIDVDAFDFSWHPYAEDDPYIYQFGTQWQKTGGPRYIAPGAEETQIVKYIDTRVLKATKLPSTKNWVVPNGVSESNFDFSWHPDDTSPPYIYQFGTQWSSTGGPIYKVEGASEVKYIEGVFAKVGKNLSNWVIPDDIDVESFDFSWYPEEGTEPAIYQFGTQWQKTGGPRYVVPGAESTNIKYIDAKLIHATKLPSMKNWVIPEGVDVSTFDFSWHPDDNAAKCSYQFGTEEHAMDGPKYVTPGSGSRIVYLRRTVKEVKAPATNQFNKYYIETTLEDLINKHPNEVFWALNPDLDYSSFNFNWSPDSDKVQFTQAFGTKTNVNTQTYLVNAPMWNMGFTDINYVEDVFDAKTVIDMFFVDKGNPESKERFERLQSVFGKRIQKTRYLNSWVDTINRCINRSSTNLCWILNSELDYTGFDFNYYPNPWQMKMVHVFGTQWSHWGTTFMVNCDTFAIDTKYIKIIEHLSNLNFVKTIKANANDCIYDMYVIKHGNIETFSVVNMLKNKCQNVTAIDYRNNYYDTFKDLLALLPEKKEHYIWVCSSICDYSNFDFSYVCDPFARDQLHVFPSDKQKYGDTFLVNVNKLRELINDMATLDDYVKINFNQRQRVKRLEPPVVITNETHLSGLNQHFSFPYAIFKTEDNQSLSFIDDEPISLWKDESKTIKTYSTGNSVIVVPREVTDYVKKELYDYPYISKGNKLLKSVDMDVVFMSNNETGADDRYTKLAEALGKDPKWVNGVKGRESAIRKAAEISDTDWVLVVPGKLEISKKFNFSWQPDRMQEAKHYIFYATNPLNKLCYGHMAPVMYNKRLVLETLEYGLDFTMSKKHEIVPINTGIAHYNLDPLMTWRTAFREAIKLHDAGDVESLDRLRVWLSVAEGLNAEYSIAGAKDAIEYYDEVAGDPDKLQLSFDWEWLKNRFDGKY